MGRTLGHHPAHRLGRASVWILCVVAGLCALRLEARAQTSTPTVTRTPTLTRTLTPTRTITKTPTATATCVGSRITTTKRSPLLCESAAVLPNGSTCTGCAAWNGPVGATVLEDAFEATYTDTGVGLFSEYLYCHTYGHTIPTGATVQNVRVYIARQYDPNYPLVGEEEVRLINGVSGAWSGNKADAVYLPGVMATKTYDGQGVWGLTVAAANINDAIFGVAFKVASGGEGAHAQVDWIGTDVTYCLAATATPTVTATRTATVTKTPTRTRTPTHTPFGYGCTPIVPFDDGTVAARGGTYPPTTRVEARTTSNLIETVRSNQWSTTDPRFLTSQGIWRFDTSAYANTTISFAYLTGTTVQAAVTDVGLTEWLYGVTLPDGAITVDDYSATSTVPTGGCIAFAVGTTAGDAVYQPRFLAPVTPTCVARSGTTKLRVGFSGSTAPTGVNNWSTYSRESDNPPQLLVCPATATITPTRTPTP